VHPHHTTPFWHFLRSIFSFSLCTHLFFLVQTTTVGTTTTPNIPLQITVHHPHPYPSPPPAPPTTSSSHICRSTSALYSPLSASNSACVPSSRIRPPARTMMRSASTTVLCVVWVWVWGLV
jgi:hypothetical protein